MESEVAKERLVMSLCIPEGTRKKDIRKSMSILRERAMDRVKEDNLIRIGHEEIESFRTENVRGSMEKACYLSLGHHTEKRMSWGIKEGVVGN